MTPAILLSFDVEEFDMPLDYQFNINRFTQMDIGKKGLDQLMPLLNGEDYPSTLFTTAHFANHFPDMIKALSHHHEIASHTFYHSYYTTDHLLQSKLQLEQIIEKPVVGLRMPRMRQIPIRDIKNAGYAYDASIHPTWLPGKYNNLNFPRTSYVDHGITRIPASVSPHFRIPLFWLSFKNFPYSLYLKLALQTLRQDGYISIYLHPWEFTDIRHFGLPSFTCRGCQGPLLDKLNQLLLDLKKEAVFMTMNQFIQTSAQD
jgi:peptidoglycan/xylan/chitin deacetylase (PgdA/CDA1 family)